MRTSRSADSEVLANSAQVHVGEALQLRPRLLTIARGIDQNPGRKLITTVVDRNLVFYIIRSYANTYVVRSSYMHHQFYTSNCLVTSSMPFAHRLGDRRKPPWRATDSHKTFTLSGWSDFNSTPLVVRAFDQRHQVVCRRLSARKLCCSRCGPSSSWRSTSHSPDIDSTRLNLTAHDGRPSNQRDAMIVRVLLECLPIFVTALFSD